MLGSAILGLSITTATWATPTRGHVNFWKHDTDHREWERCEWGPSVDPLTTPIAGNIGQSNDTPPRTPGRRASGQRQWAYWNSHCTQRSKSIGPPRRCRPAWLGERSRFPSHTTPVFRPEPTDHASRWPNVPVFQWICGGVAVSERLGKVGTVFEFKRGR